MSDEATTGMSYAAVVRLGLALPEVAESTSYGTPSLKVRKKMLTRLWEDGATLVVRVDFATREALLQADPAVYYLTDHYRDYPAILVRLPVVTEAAMRELLEESWSFLAPPKLVARGMPKDVES